jgi:hypothetical protein
MTREALDAFIREVLAATADETVVDDGRNAEEAYAAEMYRYGWRG